MANNRRGKGLIGLLFILLIWGAAAVLAAVPAEINYQGSIEDLNGPVDGTLTLTFRLFDANEAGAIVWEEAHSVLVNQGIYNVILGTGTLNPSYGSLEEAVFENDDLWLEVQVAGEADAMAPRQKITSVGFAMRAGSVSDGTITATMLADDAVTTDKLVDGAVTAAKVTGGFVANLDADLLDGLNATSFATAAHSHDTRYYTQAQVDAMVNGLQGEIDALKALLLGVTRTGSNITLSGVNLHIVSGSGATNGAANGLGNLIVGYNELRGSNDDRTGSHNIVVGQNQNYSSYGGMVVGYYNSISGAYASVSGGGYNTASGLQATVSGGSGNTAIGVMASVSGGGDNTASGHSASVSGGSGNRASGEFTSVSGGYNNDANDYFSSVSGGSGNTASGYISSVSGGADNTASGESASVSGGYNNHANDYFSSVSGGSGNTASGESASVSGGRNNTASGRNAFVGGGGGGVTTDSNQAFGDYSVVLGGKRNIAGDPALVDHTIGMGASVSGGDLNKASGNYTNVSGGLANTARGYVSSIGGGYSNQATNDYSGVSGGANNTASGRFASVNGGQFNQASGSFSSVAGGNSNMAVNDFDSVVGDTGAVYVDSTPVH